jgi:hypothetical protein
MTIVIARIPTTNASSKLAARARNRPPAPPRDSESVVTRPLPGREERPGPILPGSRPGGNGAAARPGPLGLARERSRWLRSGPAPGGYGEERLQRLENGGAG